MVIKECLLRGVSKINSLIKLYAATIQRRLRRIRYIRFFAWLIAWCSFWANLILICMYVVNPRMNSAIINEVSVGLMIVVILCAVVARIASLEN